MPTCLKIVLGLSLALVLAGCPSAPKPPEKQTVAAPAITPEAGSYSDAVAVTITSSTEGAEIRYTLDGSDPSAAAGTLYTGPVTVGKTATVTAIAVKKDWLDSPIVKADYTITGQVAAVSFAPEAGTYDTTLSVKLQSLTPGARIYYTTDGSDPSPDTGTLYEGEVSLEASATVTAIAVKTGWKSSEVASAEYTLILGTVVSPVFSPEEGTYTGTQSVEITSATDGARIRYTTDGSMPTPSNGMDYEGPGRGGRIGDPPRHRLQGGPRGFPGHERPLRDKARGRGDH